MGLLDKFRNASFDGGVERFRSTPGAVLIDVRDADEYASGHVPGSVNVSLRDIEEVGREAPDAATPLFVYCQSGMRSRRAVSALKRMGYAGAESIGGIAGYTGPVER